MWPSAWPGKLDDLPAVELAALVQQLRVAREADERRERMPCSISSCAIARGTPCATNHSAIRSGQSSDPQTRSHCA